MEENKEILQVKDLAVAFQTYRGKVKAVRNVSFDLKRGQALGIVGESGCGKSVTSHAIMGLLPKENSIIENGQILWQGQDLVNFQDEDLAKIRGNKIAMIFQDPMTSLNPVLTIGTQIKEVLFCINNYRIKKRQKSCRIIKFSRDTICPKKIERLSPSIQWRYASTCDDCNGTCL